MPKHYEERNISLDEIKHDCPIGDIFLHGAVKHRERSPTPVTCVRQFREMVLETSWKGEHLMEGG